MTRYTIDYGWSTADFWCEETDPERVLDKFMRHVNQCFGIRKSVTKEPTISGKLEGASMPDWAPKGSVVALAHTSDTIAWGPDGKKTLSEWE